MTFSELQSEVLDNVIDAPTVVTNAVARSINRALRTAQMRHNFSVMRTAIFPATTVDVRNLVALPADWKAADPQPFLTENLGGVRHLSWVASGGYAPLRRFGSDQTGAPQVLWEGRESTSGISNIFVYPTPDGNSDYSDGEYRITIPYWKYLPALSADADTNWFTETADEWIVARATAFAFGKDWNEARGAYWQAQAQMLWNDVLKADKYRMLTGVDTLVPSAGAWAARIGY